MLSRTQFLKPPQLCTVFIVDKTINTVNLSFSKMDGNHRYKPEIQLELRYQTSYIAPCNGVVSRWAQFGGLRVFADHTCKSKRKANALTIFARRVAFNT